jgi:hypothetical protein
MAHRKESVRPEAEIDYQAKKNLEDKHTRLYKKSRKKTDKLRKELKATIPSREHSWPKWLGGYKDTDESKRIKKELTTEHKHRKFIDKREKSLEKLGDKPIKKGIGTLEKRRLLDMGVYRDKKGGEVLEAHPGRRTQTERLGEEPFQRQKRQGGGIAQRGLGRAFVKGGKA